MLRLTQLFHETLLDPSAAPRSSSRFAFTEKRAKALQPGGLPKWFAPNSNVLLTKCGIQHGLIHSILFAIWRRLIHRFTHVWIHLCIRCCGAMASLSRCVWSRWANLVSHGPQEDGFADGATSGPCGLWAAACQWEPTLAALPLRQSPRTDGANAGLRSSAKPVSRNEQAQIYAAAGALVSSWPLLVRRSAMGRGGGARGGYDKCVTEKKTSLLVPGDWLGPVPAPTFSCGVRVASVRKARPLKVTPGGEGARNSIRYFIFLLYLTVPALMMMMLLWVWWIWHHFCEQGDGNRLLMVFNCPSPTPGCPTISEMKGKYKAELWKTICLCESISYTQWSKNSKHTAAQGLGTRVGGLRGPSAQVGCCQAGSGTSGRRSACAGDAVDVEKSTNIHLRFWKISRGSSWVLAANAPRCDVVTPGLKLHMKKLMSCNPAKKSWAVCKSFVCICWVNAWIGLDYAYQHYNSLNPQASEQNQ